MTPRKILPGDVLLFPDPRNGKDGGNERFDSVEIGNDSPRISHVGPKTGFPSREEARGDPGRVLLLNYIPQYRVIRERGIASPFLDSLDEAGAMWMEIG